MNKTQLAKDYCAKIYAKHNYVTQALLVEYDRTHGKQLLTWDDKKAAERYRLDEAAEIIAALALERLAGKTKRAYYNAVKVTESGVMRAYYPVEDIVADEQMYESARAIFIAQINGLTRQFSYLEEARQLAEYVEAVVQA